MLLGDFRALGFSGEIWPLALSGDIRTVNTFSGDIWTLGGL